MEASASKNQQEDTDKTLQAEFHGQGRGALRAKSRRLALDSWLGNERWEQGRIAERMSKPDGVMAS